MVGFQYRDLHRPQIRVLQREVRWLYVVSMEDLVSSLPSLEGLPGDLLDPTLERQYVPLCWYYPLALPSCKDYVRII